MYLNALPHVYLNALPHVYLNALPHACTLPPPTCVPHHLEQEARAALEEDMKQAFMRGVCALNIEAMAVMKRGAPPGGANPCAPATVTVQPRPQSPGPLAAKPTPLAAPAAAVPSGTAASYFSRPPPPKVTVTRAPPAGGGPDPVPRPRVGPPMPSVVRGS
eukprot:365157-Chlamydomonas_euryale.AAC.25